MQASKSLTLKELAEQQQETEKVFTSLINDALQQAKSAGAEQAEIWCYNTVGNSIDVRNQQLETLEFNQDSRLSLNLYFDKRKGSISINDVTASALSQGVKAATDIAQFTEADEYAGLADKSMMATEFKALSLDHPSDVNIEQMIEQARACEQEGLEYDNIKQSEGASFNCHRSIAIYANSHGFLGSSRTSRYSLSANLIAENQQGMQRDGWYSSSRVLGELESAKAIGKQAAKRVTERLQQGKSKAGVYPVVFLPEVARSIWAHFFSAIKGGALYQRASFLLDKKGQQILPDFIQIHEDPFILKGFGSGNYDSEGVAVKSRQIVQDGVLEDYFLSSYSARKLGLQTTGNAGGIHNIVIADQGQELSDLLKQIGTGLLVREVMGQGVNIVTGNYSRGASGFWVENGQIQHFVQEITIAGNLTDMLSNIISVANDVDHRSSILTGSLAIDGMTITAS